MTQLRIASLLAGSTEILYGLGLGDSVVAISHECDHPPQALSKPRVTASAIDAHAASAAIDVQVREMTAAGEALYAIDHRRLRELRPDLIVTQAQCDVCAVSFDDVSRFVSDSPELSATRIVAMNPSRLDELFEDIERIADAAGAPDAGMEFVEGLRRRASAVSDAVAEIGAPRPRVACIEWIEPVMIAANWMPELIELAGGRCDLTQAGEQSRYTPWADVVAYDPDVIVVMPCGFDLQRARAESAVLMGFEDWNKLSAVQSGRVFAVDGSAYFNRTGPRMVDSLELLAGLLHGEALMHFRKTYAHAWCTLID